MRGQMAESNLAFDFSMVGLSLSLSLQGGCSCLVMWTLSIALIAVTRLTCSHNLQAINRKRCHSGRQQCVTFNLKQQSRANNELFFLKAKDFNVSL